MLTITWKEMRKNVLIISSYILFTVGMALVFNGYLPGLFADEKEMLSTSYALLMGIFVNMIIFGGLMGNEKEEEQSNGYEFMRSLPIDAWQIVGGKFLSAFFSAIIAIATVLVVTGIFGSKLEGTLRPVAFSLFSSGVALVLVGVMYLFAFRIRYSKLVVLVMLVYIGSMMLPQIANFVMLLMDMDATREQMYSALSIPVGGLIFFVCILLFAVLGYWCMKMYKITPAPQ